MLTSSLQHNTPERDARNDMQHSRLLDLTPLVIVVRPYAAASDLVEALGVSRQTLWRWRQDSEVPQELRYPRRWVVFTADERESIQQYAERLEPVA